MAKAKPKKAKRKPSLKLRALNAAFKRWWSPNLGEAWDGSVVNAKYRERFAYFVFVEAIREYADPISPKPKSRRKA